ncbi:TIGR03621 family F420-dependent LLM class oxidoreductase [Actinacidiphila acididurans]|uniref:TIGR03621 family F420-dependent LLM class oxidoreductase n=1 Tax=Actinacidiphila acididurans TaxID=2784346 RepID=A0ABS2TQW4_9ACTN|nr:TIGR03621 family F420-dependent LLM class oxidoreductase [Actinacidiphila acididurans]MBM9504353.1 TIGR03621 family F420-dependent LLM class oxidoreductase [Actinacidiphila acididurans]
MCPAAHPETASAAVGNPRPFRFGVSLFSTGSRTAWQSRARQAEDLGYDVLLVPDHFGMPAPFPALMSAAEAVSIRVGTLVLNAGLHNPALLARDAAEVHRLTEGRLEVGLGAGYQPADYEAAGLPYPSAAQRVEHLARTMRALREPVSPDDQSPGAARTQGPPLLLAGSGERMLRLAGREADIVGFPLEAGVDGGAAPAQALARRVAVVREAAADRADPPELNLLVALVALAPAQPDPSPLRPLLPGLTDEQILAQPCVLSGSAREIADELLRLRESLGITYFSVVEPSMAAFAEVIALLR